MFFWGDCKLCDDVSEKRKKSLLLHISTLSSVGQQALIHTTFSQEGLADCNIEIIAVR